MLTDESLMAPMTYTLHHAPATRSMRALWMLEEVGAPYELDALDLYAGAQRTRAHLKRNPMGKVPALTGPDDLVVTEAAAIVTFLGDAHPEAGLAPRPDATALRADYLRWMFFGAGVLEPAAMDAVMGRETDRARGAWGSMDDVVRTLQRGMRGRDWLVGDAFSGADVMIGVGVMFGLAQELTDAPALVDYAARLRARPAFHRAVAIERDLLTRLRPGGLMLPEFARSAGA